MRLNSGDIIRGLWYKDGMYFVKSLKDQEWQTVHSSRSLSDAVAMRHSLDCSIVQDESGRTLTSIGMLLSDHGISPVNEWVYLWH